MGQARSPLSHLVSVAAGPSRGDTVLFANLGLDSDVKQELHMRSPGDDSVSILFGHERLRLEFFDVESLERTRDLADEGIRRLRAAALTAQ